MIDQRHKNSPFRAVKHLARVPAILAATFLAIAFIVVCLSGVTDLHISPGNEPHECRFWGMIGSLSDPSVFHDNLVGSDRSLKTLGDNNPNGWALTYFSQDLIDAGYSDPIIVRGGPKASNEYDMRLNESVNLMKDLHPTAVIAHIRQASSGHDDVPDPHPFFRDGFLFCHNGSVDREKMVTLITADDPDYLLTHPVDYEDPYIDSELYFTLVRKYHESGVAGPRMRDAIVEAVLQMLWGEMISNATNCLATDGDTLYAVRFDHNESNTFKVKYKSVDDGWIVASQETDTYTSDWETVPPKSLGIFTPGNPPEFINIFPPSGPWISKESISIDDDMTGPSNGDDNHIANAGETIELSILLKNIGSESATNLGATLYTGEPFCQIIADSIGYPDLEPDSTGLPLEPFIITFSSEIADFLTIPFTMTVNAEDRGRETSWEMVINVCVLGPDVQILDRVVVDGNNSHAEPGELFDLEVSLKNWGAGTATNLTGTLTTITPHVTITQGTASIDTLLFREDDNLLPDFQISIAPEFPNSGFALLSLDLSGDWGYSNQDTISLPVGGFSDNMENGSGEWSHGHLLTGFSDAWHLSSVTNHSPGGGFSWACAAEEPEAPYPGLLDAVLYTPLIDLQYIAQLSFWHRIDAEEYGVPPKARDGGLVEISVDGGAWHQIFPEDGYTHIIDYDEDYGPLPEGTPVFSGHHLDWSREIFNLSDVMGQAQFRFRFGSNQAVSNAGWFIDDIVVIGLSGTARVDETADQDLAPGLSLANSSLFRHASTIVYTVAQSGEIKLNILDLQGRVVRRLLNENRPAGRHQLTWDGRDDHGQPVSSGLYFYHLKSAADRFEDSHRVVRIR